MSKPVVLIDAGELVGLSGVNAGDVLKWDAGLGQWYAAEGGGTGTVTSVTAGAGLSGGTITSSGTISMPNVGTAGTYGSASSVAVVTTDAQGRVSGATTTAIAIAQSAVTGLVTDLGNKADKSVTATAGAGLTGGGSLAANFSFALDTVGTSASNQGSASKTVTLSTDAYGRVTALSEQSISGLGAGVISSGQLATAQGGTGIDASGATNGEVLVGQSTGSFALHALSQDATMASDGKVTVQGLQARAVSSVAPTSGQTLVWSTSGGGAWVPGSQASGGSGGGGVLYYMNAGTSVPATNGIPAGTYQLGRTAEGGSHPITISSVATTGWTRVGGFVSDANDPSLTSIPAGIWDFNVWASSTANPNNMFFRLTFYAYDGSTNPESGAVLATSVSAYLYDPSQATQYTTSFALAQTAFTGKRIYIKLEVQATAANKDVTFGFGDGEASHVHTTVPSVTGSGFVKVLNDVIVSTGQTVNLASSTDVGSSVLGVGNGGTGLASLTNHGLVIGQGSAAVASLVGTTGGDIVRWNGTDWASAALSSYAVTGLTGTASQVNVSVSVGAVTLSLPQSIAEASTPTFAGLTLSGVSDGLVRATSGVLAGGATVVGSDFGSQTANTILAAPNGSSGTPSFRPLAAADIPSLSSTYLPLVGGTMTGKLTTLASASGGAGFRLPHGNAPSGPLNGDVWTTFIGVFACISGVNQQLAPLASPTFTGTPAAPTAAVDTNTTQVATTAYVVGQGYLKSATAATTYAPLASPSLTGTPTAPTASAGTNTTQIATTAFVTAAVTAGQYTLPIATASVLGGVKQGSGVSIDGSGVLSANVLSVAGRTGAVTLSVSDVSGAAPLASPTFTGTVTIPAGASISGYALLASPTFTGTPAAPTASAGTNTTQLATTAFVTTAVAAAKGAPYDVSGEAAGTLANGDEIWHFEAVRAFTLSTTTTNHRAGAVTAPSGTCVITVYKNNTSTQVFTITYTSSATGAIGSVTNNTVAAGDVLFAKITSGPSTISNPYWTLYGTI